MMRNRRAVPGHGARAVLLATLVTVIAPIVAPSAAAAAPLSPAQAPAPRAEGLDIGATFTYTIDPPANVVRVVAEITLVNTVPNTTSGNIINKTYYDGFTVPVPIEAANGAATQDGTPVPITTDAIDDVDSYLRLDVEFAKRIFYRQSTTLVVTYDIVGRAPRDPLTTRVNAAYTAFEAFGVGDPGKVTVRVVVPTGYTVDTLGSDVVRTEEGGSVVYTATDIEDPEQFGLFVSARNDDALLSTPIDVSGSTFTIRAWPGDEEWLEFTSVRIRDGLPVLEELIGSPWPVDRDVEIREAVTAELYGYAGWFDVFSRELEVSEQLDSNTLLHELSHGWFNELLFDERWASEGLAQVYAALADERLGQPALDPEPTSRDDPGAQPLNEWTTPDFTQADDDVETYGYAASWVVMDAIVDEIGVEAMAEVFDAVDTRQIPYLVEGSSESFAGDQDWRHLLDLLQERAGSETAEELLETWVLTADEIAELGPRREARRAYTELGEASEDWTLPLVIRLPMSQWEFDEAEALITEASEVLADRDALADDLDAIEVELPEVVEEQFEAERTSFDATNALIDDLADAAERLEAAFDAAAEDRDLYTRLGLRNVDLDAMLAEASSALAANDTDESRTIAADVERRLDEAPAIGRSRVLRIALAVGGGVLALIILILVWVIVRRRRRRRRAEEEPAFEVVEPVEPVDAATWTAVATEAPPPLSDPTSTTNTPPPADAEPLPDDGPPLDTL